MSPLIHLLLAFLVAYFLTSNWKYRIIAAFGGIIPDIDGIHILFDINTYYEVHHVLAHPLFVGVLLGIGVVGLFPFINKQVIEKYIIPKKTSNPLFNEYKKNSFHFFPAYSFFVLGFFIHNIADIIGTNWPINVLYPFGTLNLSIASWFSNEIIYSVINPVFIVLSVGLMVFVFLKEYKRLTGKELPWI